MIEMLLSLSLAGAILYIAIVLFLWKTVLKYASAVLKTLFLNRNN